MDINYRKLTEYREMWTEITYCGQKLYKVDKISKSGQILLKVDRNYINWIEYRRTMYLTPEKNALAQVFGL